jgi:membrane protease YdiL (CAAX protease family)
MLSGAVARGFTLFLLVGLPLMAARNSRLEEHVVELGWGLAAAAAGLGIAWLSGLIGRRAGLEESPLLRLLLPRTITERRAFLLLAGIGAVCEEYIYRGFALHVLADWTGQQWGAAALTSISFGLAHGYQRVNGILRSAGLGMVLAVPILWTGSLFPAILAHFWINAAMSSPASRWLLADVRAVDVSPAGESAEREDDSTDSTRGDGS